MPRTNDDPADVLYVPGLQAFLIGDSKLLLADPFNDDAWLATKHALNTRNWA